MKLKYYIILSPSISVATIMKEDPEELTDKLLDSNYRFTEENTLEKLIINLMNREDCSMVITSIGRED